MFTKFSELVDVWVLMINLTFVLLSPKGRCYGTQLILVAKIEHDLVSFSFFALAFHDDLDYCRLNARINSSNDLATQYKIMMISIVCDIVCPSVSVCPRYRRKTA